MKAKQHVFAVLSILIGIVLALTIGELICRVLPVSDGMHVLPVNDENPILRSQENRNVNLSLGWNFAIANQKRVNNYGFFNPQDYHVASDSPLVAVIGDSYVVAKQIADDETFYSQMAVFMPSDHRIYSFGASGAQLPTYLTFARFVCREFVPDAIIFNIVGNDFDESLFKNRNSPGLSYFDIKPDSSIITVRVDYQPSIIRRILGKSALVRYLMINLRAQSLIVEHKSYRPAEDLEKLYVGNTLAASSSSRFNDGKLAVREYFRQLERIPGLPREKTLFVVDGMRPHLYDTDLLARASNSYFAQMREYFISYARRRGYEVIDMQPILSDKFAKLKQRFEFTNDGHWNELGHHSVANAIRESVLVKNLTPAIGRSNN